MKQSISLDGVGDGAVNGGDEPHDLAAERCAIGSSIIDAEIAGEVCAILKPEDFYDVQNRAVFEGIRSCRSRNGGACDLVLLRHAIGDESLERIGGVDFLVKLAGEVPIASNGVRYAKIVREKSALRRAAREAQELLRDIGRGKPAIELAPRFRGVGKSLVALDESADEFPKLVQRARERMESGDSGLKWSLARLNQATGGIRLGETTIIGAATSQGKTSTTLNFALHLALGGRSVLYVAFENPDQIVPRLASMLSGLPLRWFREWQLRAPDEKVALSRAIERTRELATLRVVGPRKVAEVRNILDNEPADVVVFDYVQKYGTTYHRGDGSRHEAISNAYADMYDVALEYQCATFVLSQVTRKPMFDRNGKLLIRPPNMGELKESGDLENFSDNIVMLWWPWRELVDVDASDKTEYRKDQYRVIVAKDKMGEPTSFWARMDTDTLKVHDA